MMKRLFIFLLILCSFSMVSAVVITPTADEYARGVVAQIDITQCVQVSFLQLKNPADDRITVDQGRGNWQFLYNTDSNRMDGKYSVLVSCQDGTIQNRSFCVNAPGCLGAANVPLAGGPAGGANPAGGGNPVGNGADAASNGDSVSGGG